jgi:hypothetical protein
VDRREREAILGEWRRAETPRDRREQQALADDLADSPLRGKPLRRRLRNFRPAADSYIAALGGPLPWMQRLREIEALTEEHERRLTEAREELGGGRAWREAVEHWDFGVVNDLIERHNRYYPAESRLPMDPRTGDFVLVNGRPYRRAPLDAAWALDRFPS